MLLSILAKNTGIIARFRRSGDADVSSQRCQEALRRRMFLYRLHLPPCLEYSCYVEGAE
jgi:hypothetical protein